MSAIRARPSFPQPYLSSDDYVRGAIFACKMSMKVTDFMTRSVVTCSKTDSLERAAELMRTRQVECVVVTDANSRPVGLITDREIAMAICTRGARLRENQVGSALVRHVCLCGVDDDDDVSDVEEVMRFAHIPRLLVTDANGQVVGLVTLSDSAHHLPS